MVLFHLFGLEDQPLEWLKSFLSDRSNCGVFGSSRSPWVSAILGCHKVLFLDLLFTADVCPLLVHRELLCQLFGRCAFSVVGPSIWNELPLELRSLLVIHPSKFYKSLKSSFLSRGWAGRAE